MEIKFDCWIPYIVFSPVEVVIVEAKPFASLVWKLYDRRRKLSECRKNLSREFNVFVIGKLFSESYASLSTIRRKYLNLDIHVCCNIRWRTPSFLPIQSWKKSISIERSFFYMFFLSFIILTNICVVYRTNKQFQISRKNIDRSHCTAKCRRLISPHRK